MSGLVRLLAEETQVCPISMFPNPVLEECRTWELSEQTKQTEYNCTNDEYLLSLPPGKYEGIVANYLSFNTDQATPHFRDRAKLFEQCTGGTIYFAEADDIFKDPIQDLGSSLSTGSEVYDAYLMIYSFTSEPSSLGLLETLNDRIRASNQLLKYEDILPKVRSMGEYRKDGKTNIDLLMADGDFFVPIIRIDLLEKYNLSLPHTWEEVVEYAKFFNGTDLNDDGIADDFGFCHYPRAGSGFNDEWVSELMYSTWATTDQTKGIQEGFFFDDETFEPRIGPGFEYAANIWKDLWAHGGDGCITPNFVTGRCAIGFAPPGCWKGVFVDADEGGVARRDENGTEIWRPRMANGDYAEPYRFRPMGSFNIVDRNTNKFVACSPETCPKGQRIPTDYPDDDRANVLVPSPHAGKLINYSPFYWSGGYGMGIRKSANEDAKNLMWDFFVYVNTPITSVMDVVLPSWLDSWRKSQLSDYEANFKKGGWSEDSFNEHQKVMLWALGNEVNSAFNLRLPGVLSYTHEVVGGEIQKYIQGSITMEDMKANVVTGWNDITTTHGKLKQLQIYRASLGLDPLSQYDLCRLHREEMDHIDPSVCKEAEDNSKLIIIVLCSIVGVGILAGIIYFSYKRYVSYQRIRKAHEQLMESTLNEATRALRQLDYPLHLVRGDEFISEGRLVRHEVMRNTHKLTVLDSLSDVDAFTAVGKQIVFFSHQWTSFSLPDPSNHQYDAMVNAMKELAKLNGWDETLKDVFVWVDYSCIPQANSSTQNLAIRSLAVYASSATYFVVVAPETRHADLDNVCDLDTYQRRMWCRAEQVCHSMRNGTQGMYLATSGEQPQDIKLVPVKSDFFLESLHVFNGELTCCRFEHKGMDSCDRQSLVVPLLGLYGELCRAAHDGIKGASGDADALASVEAFLKEIEDHQEEVFPRTFQRVMWRKNRKVTEEVLLFGDLIDRMKARIKAGTMLVISDERGGTESTKSGTDFVRHGASDFIRHGCDVDVEENVMMMDHGSNFLRHGSVVHGASQTETAVAVAVAVAAEPIMSA